MLKDYQEEDDEEDGIQEFIDQKSYVCTCQCSASKRHAKLEDLTRKVDKFIDSQKSHLFKHPLKSRQKSNEIEHE